MPLINSCATILNSPAQRIDIITNKHADVAINGAVLANVNKRTKIIALRDIRPVEFSVFNDTLSKQLVLGSRNSTAYWLNLYPSLGLGMLIDKDSPKRYAYPKRVYVDMTNNMETFTTYNPVVRKGSLMLHVSFPWINSFLLKPTHEKSTKYSTGFMGLMTGLDYFYRANRFINTSFGGVIDFFVPFPGAVDFSGEVDFTSSVFLSLSDNYRFKRLTSGYGLSISKNIWAHKYFTWGDPPPPARDPVTRTDYSLGLVFPFYIQTGEYFNIGVIYRPSFLTVSPSAKFKYEHLVSVDFAWKIPLTK